MRKYILLSILTLLCSLASAQNKDTKPQAQNKLVVLSGVVLDDNSESLIGVSIKTKAVKGQKRYSAISDLSGNFMISVPDKSVVEFTYMGYEKTTIKVNGPKNKMKVYLSEKTSQIDDVVIMGYRRVSKADVTSAATVVKAKDLAQAPVANAIDLLQGRVAGLDISQNSGAPGTLGTINIRGVSDISVQAVSSNGKTDYILGSATPLFVIDGIPQENVGEYNSEGLLSGSGISPISSVPFEDIDNIQVLKDAAATALYGSRGAYGVVIIETKRGSGGRPRIIYSMDMKVNMPPKLRSVIAGRDERLNRLNQILQNDTSVWHGYLDVDRNQALTDSLNPYYNNHTDWQGNFYRTTTNTTHNLQVSGGSDKFNYKINGNYYTEAGIIRNTDFNRYGLRTNFGYRPNNKFDMYAAVNITYGKQGSGSGNALQQTGVASGSSASSLLPPPSIYTASNSALGAIMIESNNNSISYDANVAMNYALMRNLRWSGTMGYTYSNSEFDSFTPGILNSYNAILKGNSNVSNRYYLRTSLDWSGTVAIFRLGMNVMLELSSSKSTSNGVTQDGLPSDNLWGSLGYNASSGSTKMSTSDNVLSFSMAPRVSLGSKSIGDRYVFTPSLRPEASAAYGKQVKWVINPGLGFKWNYFMEPFMAKAANTWLDYGAIRVSWGRTTKYKADRYDIWGTYLLSGNSYNGSQSIPISFDALPNVNLSPVTTTQWNIGTDLNILKSKLQFVIDAYYKQVDNQLSSINLADHNAFTMIQTTDVSIVNYGLEFTVNAKPLRSSSPLYMNIGFNFAINKDIIAKLPNSARQIINNQATVVNRLGANALSNYLYVYKGVYATDDDVPVDPVTGRRLRVGGSKASADNPDAYFRAGDPIWADLNGDYVIDENDKMIVGNSQPRLTGGFSLNLRYRRFTVFTSFSFKLKRDIINKVLADQLGSFTDPGMNFGKALSNGAAMIPVGAYDFWTKDHIHAEYPNPYDYQRATLINPYRADQTLFLEDGSYLKINGITFSWQFPSKWMRAIGIESASLRANLSNIYTFTKYSGVNPENVNSLGQDTSGGYPSARSFSFGLNISL